LVLGLLAAWGLARVLAVLLYGLDPADPPVFVAVTLLVLGASVLACWLPGRRATRLSLTEALRHE
jgi:ABC-type lipoprotein release transport system permease subunit